MTLSQLFPSVEQSLDKKSLWPFLVSTSHLTLDFSASRSLVFNCYYIHNNFVCFCHDEALVLFIKKNQKKNSFVCHAGMKKQLLKQNTQPVIVNIAFLCNPN